MYLNDKITEKEEIVSSGVFEIHPGRPFYLFLLPKDGYESFVSTIVDAKLLSDKELSPCPVVTNIWNPMVFRQVKISDEILGMFRVFRGTEGQQDIAGFNIGVGIGLRFQGLTATKPEIIPDYESCFGTGVWLNNRRWKNDDTWSYTAKVPTSCFGSGRWIATNKWRYSERWRMNAESSTNTASDETMQKYFNF